MSCSDYWKLYVKKTGKNMEHPVNPCITGECRIPTTDKPRALLRQGRQIETRLQVQNHGRRRLDLS